MLNPEHPLEPGGSQPLARIKSGQLRYDLLLYSLLRGFFFKEQLAVHHGYELRLREKATYQR